jgi:hypothetical protein
MNRPPFYVRVVCPRCGNETQKEIGWLHEYAQWPCENPVCRGGLQLNLNDLDAFVRTEAVHHGGRFLLKKYPEEPL